THHDSSLHSQIEMSAPPPPASALALASASPSAASGGTSTAARNAAAEALELRAHSRQLTALGDRLYAAGAPNGMIDDTRGAASLLASIAENPSGTSSLPARLFLAFSPVRTRTCSLVSFVVVLQPIRRRRCSNWWRSVSGSPPNTVPL